MRREIRTAGMAMCVGLALAAGRTSAAPNLVSTFPSGIGGVVGIGYEPLSSRVWLYGDFTAVLSRYTMAGVSSGTIPGQGESANDADIEFAPADLVLGSVNVPAGSLLFINGETGVAEIYAINPASGALIGSLATAFGVSHVVGGGYHAQRHTFFLVQDKVPGGTSASRVAEVDPVTGAVLNSFQVTAILPSFTVNYGDLDIAPNGNLLIVSSDEASILELTPTGGLVATHALPVGVSGLSGIAVDTSSCSVWVVSSGGTVWQLGNVGASCAADRNCDGGVDISDLLEFLIAFEAGGFAADLDDGSGTGTTDGGVDISDLLYFLAHFEAGC